MASISSLTGSGSTSSIYGNSNVISGLASGMDTEAMVENAVSGIQAKISGLQQDRTKLEWEQEAYRSIIDKMTAFADKYTDYTSSTNLLSRTFFTNAMKVTASGTYAGKVSGLGSTSSDISIKKATMATAATYSSISSALAGAKLDTTKKIGELVQGDLSLTVNGKAITGITADSTIAEVLSKISKSDANVTATYSEAAGEFYLKNKETGAGTIEFGGSVAEALFGAYDSTVAAKGAGNDATLVMTVNGKENVTVTDKSNQINVDGMTINIKGDFEVTAGQEAVSFTTAVDSDKIVDAIKSMVADYNAMANEIKDAYSTQPLYTSKGKRYEPLTEKDQEDMSETAIEKHEEKAKTGLLFGDSTLSSLYNELRSTMNELGFADIGLSTEYSAGKTTLVLDESKLRSVLENDPDKVTEALAGEETVGLKTNGLMEKLKGTLDTYAKTTGTKGLLVQLAGSTKSPLSLNENTYKDKIDRLDETITRWQEKLADKVDYYTRQFTRLEQLISEMNSQSSTLWGMTGGY